MVVKNESLEAIRMKKQIYRHGDVIFHEVERIEGKSIKHDGKFVVAIGEATGHSHQLLCEPSATILKGKRNFFEIEQEAELIHQQHKTLKVQKGKYAQIQEREMDNF